MLFAAKLSKGRGIQNGNPKKMEYIVTKMRPTIPTTVMNRFKPVQ
jgi:hypothetical protein